MRLQCGMEDSGLYLCDLRFVCDTITQDIVKFRPIGDGEDAQFCDLYSAANDPRPQIIPRPEMIPKLDPK